MINSDEIFYKVLKCPVCGEDVYRTDDKKSLYCTGQKRHCFDFSSDGYVNLSRVGGGDSKQAINARKSFLSQDYYLPIAQKIREVVTRTAGRDKILLDAGCGEGYYTNILAEACSGILGFDLSKFGVMAASKSAKKQGIENTFYATASVFELPVKDGCVDCVVNIFAPCAQDEYLRVLADGGYLIVVGAGPDHLMGLKKVLYDNTYENKERADLPTHCELVDRITYGFEIEVEGRENIDALFSMTPYYWRTSESDKDKLLACDRLKTRVEFEIYVYQKN